MHIAHTCTSYLVEDTHPHQSIQRMQMQREIENARQDTMRLQCKDAHEDTMHCDAYEGRASLSSGTLCHSCARRVFLFTAILFDKL